MKTPIAVLSICALTVLVYFGLGPRLGLRHKKPLAVKASTSAIPSPYDLDGKYYTQYFSLGRRHKTPLTVKASTSVTPSPYESDGQYYAATASYPQFYWANEDTNSCAYIEFDPASWQAGVSRERSEFDEWTPDMHIRDWDQAYEFDMKCAPGDDVFETAAGKKTFSPRAAIRQLETDELGKPLPGPFTAETFATDSGLTGVRVVRTFDLQGFAELRPDQRRTFEIRYLLPTKHELDETERTKIVVIKITLPVKAGERILTDADQMVSTLKFPDRFPNDEPRNRQTGYLSADLKQIYGEWTVAMCHAEFPTAMRWTISPIDRRQALVTIGEVQRWEEGVKRNYRLAASFKSNIVRVGNENKLEVMLSGSPNIQLVPWSRVGQYKVQYVYSDSPITLDGQLDPVGWDWDARPRGDLNFTRSNGKPLDARQICKAEQ
jgi:hypothetical protein